MGEVFSFVTRVERSILMLGTQASSTASFGQWLLSFRVECNVSSRRDACAPFVEVLARPGDLSVTITQQLFDKSEAEPHEQ